MKRKRMIEDVRKKKKKTQSEKEDAKDNQTEPGELGEIISSQTEGKKELGINKEIASSPIEETPGEITSQESGLSKNKLILILKELYQGMTITIQQLSQDPKFQQQGIPEEEMAKNLQKYFKIRVGQMRKVLYTENKTTDEEFNQTLEKYKEDKEISKLCVRIAKVNKALQIKQDPLTEAELAQIPEGLTVERLIEMMQEMDSSMYKMQMELMLMQEAQTTPPSSLFRQQCQQKVMDLQSSIFAKYEVDEDITTLAMQKYSMDPKLQNAIMELQQRQSGQLPR